MCIPRLTPPTIPTSTYPVRNISSQGHILWETTIWLGIIWKTIFPTRICKTSDNDLAFAAQYRILLPDLILYLINHAVFIMDEDHLLTDYGNNDVVGLRCSSAHAPKSVCRNSAAVNASPMAAFTGSVAGPTCGKDPIPRQTSSRCGGVKGDICFSVELTIFTLQSSAGSQQINEKSNRSQSDT